jgi:hypothetical protein
MIRMKGEDLSMDLQKAFQSLKTAYSVSKDVTLDELGIVLTLEPPDSTIESSIIEACSDVDGGAYLEAVKDHSLAYAIRALNGERIQDVIKVNGEDGEVIEKTRYLFMLEQVRSWPQPLKDLVFDAYSDLLSEIQTKIEAGVKFERFVVSSSVVKPPVPDDFKMVEDPGEELTDVEKVTQQVRDEQEQVEQTMAQTESRAMEGGK